LAERIFEQFNHSKNFQVHNYQKANNLSGFKSLSHSQGPVISDPTRTIIYKEKTEALYRESLYRRWDSHIQMLPIVTNSPSKYVNPLDQQDLFIRRARLVDRADAYSKKKKEFAVAEAKAKAEALELLKNEDKVVIDQLIAENIQLTHELTGLKEEQRELNNKLNEK
jgi:hypothetical protein